MEAPTSADQVGVLHMIPLLFYIRTSPGICTGDFIFCLRCDDHRLSDRLQVAIAQSIDL
ncbi:MAG: hypothetical protein F6K65_22655 [Moorea sp. SIO3C2]|nr:hypothetical protein [Moorena sp. SIO3C2]